jgi:hypothetical protein
MTDEERERFEAEDAARMRTLAGRGLPPPELSTPIYRPPSRNNIRGEAGALSDIARGLQAALKDSAIQLPVTIMLDDAEIYVSGAYVRIELEEVSPNEPTQQSS